MTMKLPVYLESGTKRTFAAAIDWPGWCRSGRDEADALAELLAYGARYERAIRSARLGFSLPKSLADLKVVEKLRGGTTTDFGAPQAAPKADSRKMDAEAVDRYGKLLRACWSAFDGVVGDAGGRKLRKGPRGGGRNLDKVVEHVLGAEEAYLSRLGRSFKAPGNLSALDAMRALRQAVLEGLQASATGRIPAKGPRGGARWSPRYFVRRAAWHVLDHAWEIEDRLL
jgi:hypothetical protein